MFLAPCRVQRPGLRNLFVTRLLLSPRHLHKKVRSVHMRSSSFPASRTISKRFKSRLVDDLKVYHPHHHICHLRTLQLLHLRFPHPGLCPKMSMWIWVHSSPFHVCTRAFFTRLSQNSFVHHRTHRHLSCPITPPRYPPQLRRIQGRIPAHLL